jgi:hypothetical protein
MRGGSKPSMRRTADQMPLNILKTILLTARATIKSAGKGAFAI